MENFIKDKFKIVPLNPKDQGMNIFSVDVEDWFHSFYFVEPLKIEQWNNLPSVVENGFYRIVELLLKYKAKATFFFLGWVAKKYPHLVKECNKNGFEIASHGFFHQEVYKLSMKEFFDDLVSSKKLLEDISGEKVLGYRAPSFTLTDDTDWFYPTLISAEYRYDSSLFPAKRKVGGLSTNYFAPFEISYSGGRLLEFPITVAKVLNQPFCFFGGGYFRFFPFFVFLTMAKQVKTERRPIIVYIHPRELYFQRVKQKMTLIGRFKNNVNLKSTPQKVEKVLKRFVFTSFKDYISTNYGKIWEAEVPNETSKLEVKRFFDDYASGFTSIYLRKKSFLRKIIDGLFRKSVYLRFTKTIENCRPIVGKTVLDIGCGPGLYSIELARIGASKVVGIDFAPKMIELAKKFAQEHNVYNKCEFIVADFLEWDFPEKFDYTIAMGYFDYCSEPAKVLKKILDLTKEKAFISIPYSQGFLAWQRKIRYKLKCPLFLYSKDEIIKIIKSVTDFPFTIEKLPREYYVTIYVPKSGQAL